MPLPTMLSTCKLLVLAASSLSSSERDSALPAVGGWDCQETSDYYYNSSALQVKHSRSQRVQRVGQFGKSNEYLKDAFFFFLIPVTFNCFSCPSQRFKAMDQMHLWHNINKSSALFYFTSTLVLRDRAPLWPIFPENVPRASASDTSNRGRMFKSDLSHDSLPLALALLPNTAPCLELCVTSSLAPACCQR